MRPIALLVKNGIGPKVQSGKARFDQNPVWQKWHGINSSWNQLSGSRDLHTIP